jgi:hypothetical protein
VKATTIVGEMTTMGRKKRDDYLVILDIRA